jgi:hypothetical protein
MPNNSNARREKGKKKKDRNRQTDPSPLHKEDKASTDSSSLFLSLTGQEKASKDNFFPGADETSMDSFFRSYAGRDMETLEAELVVPGHEQHVFVTGYRRSLSIRESFIMQDALMQAHPNVHAKDLAAHSKAQMLKAGLEALKKWRHEEKDSSLLSLSSEDMDDQDYTLALDRMEKAIQENPDAVHDEGADWSWAMLALRVENSRATTMEERVDMRDKFREEIRRSNQLVSRAELKSQLYLASNDKGST